MQLAHKHYPDYGNDDSVHGWAVTGFAVGTILAIIIGVVIPLVGLAMLVLVSLTSIPYYRWRKRTEPERTRQQKERGYLVPIRERLYEYAQKNDFKGALDFAVMMQAGE